MLEQATSIPARADGERAAKNIRLTSAPIGGSKAPETWQGSPHALHVVAALLLVDTLLRILPCRKHGPPSDAKASCPPLFLTNRDGKRYLRLHHVERPKARMFPLW